MPAPTRPGTRPSLSAKPNPLAIILFRREVFAAMLTLYAPPMSAMACDKSTVISFSVSNGLPTRWLAAWSNPRRSDCNRSFLKFPRTARQLGHGMIVGLALPSVNLEERTQMRLQTLHPPFALISQSAPCLRSPFVLAQFAALHGGLPAGVGVQE